MIRIATLDPFEPELLDSLIRTVYQAYGLGCAHAGELPFPSELKESKEGFDALRLLECAPAVTAYGDDRVLYLTSRPLAPRASPGQGAQAKRALNVPTPGFTEPTTKRGVVTSHGLPKGEKLAKALARQLIHDVGHLWELHHCLDPKCAMFPPWTPEYQAAGEPVLCLFCRDKSERAIRPARS